MGYYRIGCRLWSGLPGCEREPEPNAPDGSNFRETSPAVLPLYHRQRAAFFAPVRRLRESKESGTVHRNTERPRNAAGEGMFRLNTDGVLLWGAGLCGRRYSRCTHCHEPHGGTVSNQTISRSRKQSAWFGTCPLSSLAITYLSGSRLHQPDIPVNC